MAITHKILTKDGIREKALTPIKAIRAKCMQCSNWQYGEVAECPITDCGLWIYRMGKNPDRKGLKKLRE
jgi:hypothetical protein